jgi:cell filamentation protein
VTFDPFGDFEIRGYLRNFASLKHISQVKDLEYASFQGNLSRAINALADIDFIEYKHVCRDRNRSRSEIKSIFNSCSP